MSVTKVRDQHGTFQVSLRSLSLLQSSDSISLSILVFRSLQITKKKNVHLYSRDEDVSGVCGLLRTSRLLHYLWNPKEGKWLCKPFRYLWSGMEISRDRGFFPEAVWCICCWNCAHGNFLLKSMLPHQARTPWAFKDLNSWLAELPKTHIRTTSRVEGTVIFSNQPEW